MPIIMLVNRVTSLLTIKIKTYFFNNFNKLFSFDTRKNTHTKTLNGLTIISSLGID